MWRKETIEYETKNLPLAIEFTGDHVLYGNAMMRVIKEWPISTEQNLTDNSINKKAWIGHAACCIEKGFPEYLVRLAWHQLTQTQQDLANLEADKAINAWQKSKIKTPQNSLF